MTKAKLLIIVSLLALLTVLLMLPVGAKDGIAPGKSGEGPGGLPACYCEVQPYSCWCIKVN